MDSRVEKKSPLYRHKPILNDGFSQYGCRFQIRNVSNYGSICNFVPALSEDPGMGGSPWFLPSQSCPESPGSPR